MKRNVKHLWRVLPLIGALLLCFLLVACVSDAPTPGESESVKDTTSGTVEETVAGTVEETEPTTAPESKEEPAPVESESDAPETSPETVPETEAPGWKPDMGKFNEGVVNYEKLVETEIVAGFPDAEVGKPTTAGANGVMELFHSDFSDGDPTVSGAAAPRDGNACGIVDGVMYMPWDANAADHMGGNWTTWAPVPGANVKNHKQVQLSCVWDVRSAGDGAWLTAMWGCYVTKYDFKIPDGPGDGLWISFNESGNKVTVYHPDAASWSAGWADIPVEAGLLSGKHQVDIVCTEDYTTRVFITAEGSTTAREVARVTFADGKIRAYNEADELIKEDACTTKALAGENFSIFVHGGGGAAVDEVSVLACAKEDEVIEHTTVTATPTEGNSLGLDITDKTDLVSICYSVWFDAILGGGTEPVTDWNNITEVLAGERDWGGVTAFHYWAKPAVGYYRSSDMTVIRKHMNQLYTAGVDFIIIDLTNAGDGYIGSSAWGSYIQKPMDAICDTIMEMRAEGEGTPYVVFWVGDGDGPLYRELYDKYHSVEKWKDCFVYWDGKPFMLTTHKQPADFPHSDLLTVRSMWGLRGAGGYAEGQWSFLNIDNSIHVAMDENGKPEQVSVAVASQETYMSMPTAHGREGGFFWFKQWHHAFDVHPKIVTLTWWNEWTAQRFDVDGKPHFTDNYNQNYSRDIEPMTGGHGDQYYQWLIEYISAYKGGKDCPILVDKKMVGRAENWLESLDKE